MANSSASLADKKKPGFLSQFLNLRLLLIFFPIALLARIFQWGDLLIFVGAGLAIVPLSELLGDATESLAAYLGPAIGGLVNATLGNAAELIITVFALQAGLLELVKASIIGSILGNLLLVTGFSFVAGGLKHGIQTFDRRTASTNTTLVILAFLALAIPSAFDQAVSTSPSGSAAHELLFSEGIAVALIVLYALTLIYSFRQPTKPPAEDVEETLEAKPNLPRTLLMLVLVTIGIAVMSEILVGTVEPLAQSLHLSQFFIGIIIVPLIGNVAEHVVSVQVALKNRMDLSLGISLGSSLQIALFVAPLLVFISLLFGQRLILAFSPYELLALATASIVATLVAQDGESNWLEGAQLLIVYVILALAFFFLPTAL